MPTASRYSGYSRNSLLTQNVRTLPLRSSEAGTMYPLMMKKTKTPYLPGSNHWWTSDRTCWSA